MYNPVRNVRKQWIRFLFGLSDNFFTMSPVAEHNDVYTRYRGFHAFAVESVACGYNDIGAVAYFGNAGRIEL